MNTDAELIRDLRKAIDALTRENRDLLRQNKDLRDAIDALLQPSPSELLARNLAHPSRQ